MTETVKRLEMAAHLPRLVTVVLEDNSIGHINWSQMALKI